MEIYSFFGQTFLILINICSASVPGNETRPTPPAVENKNQEKNAMRPGNNKSSLVQAHMQFRTGLYTPNSLSESRAEIYPGLLHPFPELPKLVLTNEGKTQMFKLGAFFRWWYGQPLNYTYDPLQYRIVSSTCVWNIESANVVWAGMFPFNEADQQKSWNPNLNIWPIPVHLEHRLARRGPTVLLEGTDPPCPRIKEMIEASSQYNDFLVKWNWLWQYLCYCAKTPGGSDFMEALNVAAALMVDQAYPEKVPTWANDSLIRSSTTMYFDYLRMLASFYDALRISTGWWWELLLLEFNRAIQGKSQRRIVQYASHNDMLVSCLSSVADTIDMWPDWGAGFSVELHKRGTKHIVEIWGWLNPNQPEPLQLNITDCSAPCSLQDFSRIVSKYHVTDPRFECGSVEPGSGSLFPGSMFAIFLASLVLCLISVSMAIRQYSIISR